ncbi:hypothetical protein Avbf_04485 [Armadillidium vulgare]|nr:hypothetical protein Avbf_04485 [Armadillidium vulgare]
MVPSYRHYRKKVTNYCYITENLNIIKEKKDNKFKKTNNIKLEDQIVSLLTLTTQSDQKRFCPYLRDLVGESNKISGRNCFENWLRIDWRKK